MTKDPRVYLAHILECAHKIERFTTDATGTGRRAVHGPRPPFGGPFVPIDRDGRSPYRVVIYSPSDQPVSASAGVFQFEAPRLEAEITDDLGRLGYARPPGGEP